jgi:hypothetical protein
MVAVEIVLLRRFDFLDFSVLLLVGLFFVDFVLDYGGDVRLVTVVR